MPTYEFGERVLRDYLALPPAERDAFMRAVLKLVEDLRHRRIRKGLRVKPYRGIVGAFEMTWAADGRALFMYGRERSPGDPHIVWLRIGGHEIFDNP